MKRIMAILLWIMFNLLPDAAALWVLDTFWPGWMKAISKAYERDNKRAS